jgi:hypothetical protein
MASGMKPPIKIALIVLDLDNQSRGSSTHSNALSAKKEARPLNQN